MVNPTFEQRQVINYLLEWLRSGKSSYITVGGYAGTGKTTIIALLRLLIKKLNPRLVVAFCAYTGKAVRVLNQTLIENHTIIDGDSISTIHSLIYAPQIDKKGNIIGWLKKSSLKADIIIIDEASMIDEAIFKDLLTYQKPIIAIGDHGQLPPLNGSFNLMQQPHLNLNRIHRQAAGSPIIQLSVLARETGKIPLKKFGPGVVKYNRYDPESGIEVEAILSQWRPNLMVLTGFNHTRVKLNTHIRQTLNFEGEAPRVGDQVICLKNNWDQGIYNGMIGTLQKIIPIQNSQGKIEWYTADIKMLNETVIYSGKISAHQFNQPKTLIPSPKLNSNTVGDLFDFGYALTVHKAQGSQSEQVLLFEERSQHMDDEAWRRWLYTGITRAQTKLTIIGT